MIWSSVTNFYTLQTLNKARIICDHPLPPPYPPPPPPPRTPPPPPSWYQGRAMDMNVGKKVWGFYFCAESWLLIPTAQVPSAHLDENPWSSAISPMVKRFLGGGVGGVGWLNDYTKLVHELGFLRHPICLINIRHSIRIHAYDMNGYSGGLSFRPY